MSELVTLKNGQLTVTVSTLGAELQSVTAADGTEYLFNGDERFWKFRAPVCFPICGGMKNDTYSHGGKEYVIPKHGFGKLAEYEITEKSDTVAAFRLLMTPAFTEMYPFPHTFTIRYVLKENSLTVEYRVKNLSDETIYFSVGGHEAYATPGGIEEYSLEFEKEEPLDSYILDGNLLERNTVNVLNSGNVLPLKYEFFKVDALMFKHLASKSVALKHNKSNRTVRLSFPDCPYFVLWTKVGAPYLCLEPWNGIPDHVDASGVLAEKEGIESAAAGEEFVSTHTITFSH